MMDSLKDSKFETMDSTHHLLAGFKAMITDEKLKMIEVARMACGGAGFASFAGFTDAFQNTSPEATYEGDNTVMLGQASRFLFKIVGRVEKGHKLEFPYSYLNKISQVLQLQDKVKTIEDVRSLQTLD